jgi:extracellular elastinolytic metalloproteinase
MTLIQGWSDAVGLFLTRKASDKMEDTVPVGWYVIGSTITGKGIRRYPYSTNMTINPHVYSELNSLGEVHNIGEVWATVLFDMYWNLVEKLGFTPNWHDASAMKGNIVAMQLLIGGLALQPCNPSLVHARDAILLADVNHYKGAHSCEIWRAFARRGLGIDADKQPDNAHHLAPAYIDGFALPIGC